MSPADVASLTEAMELEVINASASELYEDRIAAHGARLAGAGPAEVSVVAGPEVPGGRYRFKQARRDDPGYQAENAAAAFMAATRDGLGRRDRPVAQTL